MARNPIDINPPKPAPENPRAVIAANKASLLEKVIALVNQLHADLAKAEGKITALEAKANAKP